MSEGPQKQTKYRFRLPRALLELPKTDYKIATDKVHKEIKDKLTK